MSEETIRIELKEFIEANMDAFLNANVEDSDNIFEKGFVSSIFAVQLLDFIENRFDVVVDDEHIVLNNFKSIDSMVILLNDLKGNIYV